MFSHALLCSLSECTSSARVRYAKRYHILLRGALTAHVYHCLSIRCSALHQLRNPAMALTARSIKHGVWLLVQKPSDLVQLWFGYSSSIAEVYVQTC